MLPCLACLNDVPVAHHGKGSCRIAHRPVCKRRCSLSWSCEPQGHRGRQAEQWRLKCQREGAPTLSLPEKERSVRQRPPLQASKTGLLLPLKAQRIAQCMGSAPCSFFGNGRRRRASQAQQLLITMAGGICDITDVGGCDTANLHAVEFQR